MRARDQPPKTSGQIQTSKTTASIESNPAVSGEKGLIGEVCPDMTFGSGKCTPSWPRSASINLLSNSGGARDDGLHAGAERRRRLQVKLRTVAAGDGQRSSSTPLTRYYGAKGTPPGRWMGSGLPGLGSGLIVEGAEVTEAQAEAGRVGARPGLRRTPRSPLSRLSKPSRSSADR